MRINITAAGSRSETQTQWQPNSGGGDMTPPVALLSDLNYRGLTITELATGRGGHARWGHVADGLRVLVLRERGNGDYRVLCAVTPSSDIGLSLRAGDGSGADMEASLVAAFGQFSARAEATKLRQPRPGAPPEAERNAEIDAIKARVAPLHA